MKRFQVAILQLKAMSTNTVLQTMKQAIRPNTQFFDSHSLHLPTIVDELFQRGNQYATLENDVIATTKRTVVSTYDLRRDSWGRGKMSHDGQNKGDRHESRDSQRTNS